MGQRAARALHLTLSGLGAILFLVFVIPRWWVLTGDLPATLATAGRIVTGVPVAAAAIPVVLTLQRTLKPDLHTPELALRLRAWSAVLHAVAGGVILAAAVAEIWLSLQAAGPWLFAVYGAAGCIAIIAVLAFALSFSAERPAAPAKPKKAKKPKKARRQKPEPAPESAAEPETEVGTETEVEAEVDAEVEAASAGAALLNKRPTGKRRHRLRS